MEKLIGAGEFLEVIGFKHTRLSSNNLVKLLHQARVACFGQGSHDFQLNGAAKELSLTGQGEVDRTHDRRMLRKHFDELFLFELHQGISDRRRAEAKLLGESGAGQHHPGTQLKRNDPLAQELEDLYRRVAGAVETR